MRASAIEDTLRGIYAMVIWERRSLEFMNRKLVLVYKCVS